jgi:hypothetical protein
MMVGKGKIINENCPLNIFPPFSLSSTIHENCQQLYFIAYRMGRFFHRRRRCSRLLPFDEAVKEQRGGEWLWVGWLFYAVDVFIVN